jgi:hypothetical protein
MFYTKNKLKNGQTIKTIIAQLGVVTHCPECCEEFHVDLAEFVKRGNFELYNSEVVCKKCSRKLHEKEKQSTPLTLEVMQVLTVALRNAGYGEKVLDLCRAYGVDVIEQLPKSEYSDFGDALMWMCKAKLLDGDKTEKSAEERLLISIFENNKSKGRNAK